MKRERDHTQEALPPEVAAALSALRPTPAPEAAPWEARRRAFLTEARQFSAEAISPTPIVRRKTWKDLFPFQSKEGSMVALVKVLVAVALIFGMTAGTVSASQESLPGSVLYPVKLQYENVRLATTGDGEAKALLALAYAQERVDEVVSLVERGDEVPEPLTARYELQVGTALQTMAGLGEAQQLQLRTHFSGTLQNQARVMTQLMARLHQGENPEHPEPTQARIQTMLQTMQQTQQQLGAFGPFGPHVGGNETPGNAEAPGPNPSDNGNGEDNAGDNGNGEDNGQQCFGDCEGHYGETKDRDKQHKNGEANGGNPSDKGQNKNNKGGSIDNGSGSDNGGNGAPNDGGGSDNGGSDTGGNGDGGTGNTGGGEGGTGGDGGSGNGGDGGSGNGNGGGSGGGGGN